MRAVVLAAGEGLRLRPLTAHKPKVMIEVANRPIISYVVEALVEAGIREITMVVGYKRERVQSYFEDGGSFRARIRYAVQERRLGTAHAFSAAKARGEDVLVVPGDNIIDSKLVKELVKERGDIVLGLQRHSNPSKYGVATLERDRVTSLEEKPRQPQSDLVSTGVYRISKSMVNQISQRVRQGVRDLPEIVQGCIAKGGAVRGVVTTGLWLDAVYPWDLLRLNFELLHRQGGKGRSEANAKVRKDAVVSETAHLGEGCLVDHHAYVGPGTTIGSHATVGPGSIIENSILMKDAQVRAGAIIRNSIVGEGSVVGDRFLALTGPAKVELAGESVEASDFGCLIGEDAQIGGNVVVSPSVLIGNGSRIEANAQVRRSVPDGAVVL